MTEQMPEREGQTPGSTDEELRRIAGGDGGEYRENDLTADDEPTVDPADAEKIVPSGGVP